MTDDSTEGRAHQFSQKQHVVTFARVESLMKALRDVLRLIDEADDVDSVMLLRRSIRRVVETELNR